MRTVASLNVLIIIFAIALFPAICFSSSQGKLEVKGIRIISDGYGTDIDGLKPFNAFKGTSVSCLAILQQGGIIKFDQDNSSLVKFVDNLGNNLMNDKIPVGSGIGMMNEISSDKKIYEIAYNLQKQPETLNLSIICWEDIKKVRVPFDLQVSVGL